MKTQPLPPSISAALAEVANIADRLAGTCCSRSINSYSEDMTACQDNLDAVASALTWKDLEHAPAMLNAAARAFRKTFPSDSLGWEHAGRLQTIASDIAAAAVWNDAARRQEKVNAAWNDAARRENLGRA